jgi:hypothetical protein
MGIVAFNYKELSCRIPKYYILFIGFVIFCTIWNIGTVKISSFIYTIIISAELLILSNLLSKSNLKSLIAVLKGIILTYFINVFITTFFILKQITPPGFLSSIFQIYKDPTGQIRPFGFSNEPSYAAIILVFVLVVFLRLNKYILQKKDYKWYAFAILTILLIKSSYGYMFLGAFLIHALYKTGFLRKHLIKLISVITLTAIIITFFNFKKIIENKAVTRIIKLNEAFFQTKGDLVDRVNAMTYIDGSAAMRLFPTVLLIDYYKTCKVSKMLFGNGAGQATKFYTKKFQGNKTELGLFPAFIYNYGIIGTIVAFLFFYALFPKRKLLHFSLFFLFCFNADFNTQIFQFILFTAMLAKFIDNQTEEATKITITN